MSVLSSFDLDTLTHERFQELCSAILIDTFSQLVEPHGRPGRDGGIDAELIGEAMSYNDLLKRPIPSRASDGADLLWVFQVKHIRLEGAANRQRAVVTALREEIASWKERKGTRPTHFYLLTNVNLARATKASLKNLGKYFPRFECWGEEKISPFVAASVALQNAFFGGYGKLVEELSKISVAVQGTQAFIENWGTKAAKTHRSRGPRAKAGNTVSFAMAIQKLVQFEVSFLRTNDAFLAPFQYPTKTDETPADWKRFVFSAPKGGILLLSQDKPALAVLMNEIIQKNAGVTLWHRYLGERTERGDNIVSYPLRRIICNSRQGLVPRRDRIFLLLRRWDG